MYIFFLVNPLFIYFIFHLVSSIFDSRLYDEANGLALSLLLYLIMVIGALGGRVIGYDDFITHPTHCHYSIICTRLLWLTGMYYIGGEHNINYSTN